MSSLAQVMKTFKRNPEDPSYTPAVALALEREKGKCSSSAAAFLQKQGGDADSEDGAELLQTLVSTCLRNAVVMNQQLSSCPSVRGSVLQ